MGGFFLSADDALVPAYLGQYDPWWVAASIGVALVSSVCAMEMSRRLSDVAARRLWLPSIALVMGMGIWAMHFVGMLAFRLDCQVDYQAWVTGLSMLPGMAAAVVALNDQARNRQGRRASSFVVPALILGCGIGVMHYAGMAAMVFEGTVRYEPVLLVSSVLLAVVFAFVALRLNHALSTRRSLKHPFLASLTSGASLALAITAMHYSAMEAAYFLPLPALPLASPALNPRAIDAIHASPDQLASWVLWVSLGLILTSLLLTYVSTRFAAARQRIEAILAASTQGFVQIDSQGCITDCNPALADLWGQPRAQLLGQTFQHLFVANSPPFAPGACEAELARPAGRLPCLVTFNEVRNDEGKLLYAFAWLADLSTRWRAEALLTQAKQAAEQAARMKSDFLSNMSHEIRTPMNAIMGMTHLLQRTPLNPKQRDYLAKMDSANQHLLGLINDILDLSKIEAGKLALECNNFKLDTLLKQVLSLVSGKAHDKRLALSLEVAPDVPALLRGDTLRLTQILVNYVNNAIKFTASGHVRLQVACCPAPASGTWEGQSVWLQFSVQDSGIGLSEEAQSRLFQNFQQADSSTSRRFGGTGLGLAICKQLAQLMDGEVGVHSQLGHGSTFWFTARLRTAEAAQTSDGAKGLEADTALASPALPEAWPGLRVLLAEDNPINQLVAQEILSGMGVQLTVADDGAKALAALAEQRFDLVLMDMQMPHMDGLEATRRLRQQADLADLPVVAMTANVMPEAIADCLQAGMNDHLAKPLDLLALRQKLARWAPQHTPAQHAQQAHTEVKTTLDLATDTPAASPASATPPHTAQPLASQAVESAASAASLVPALAQVHGLDVAAGLRHLQHNSTLYVTLLRRFVATEHGFGARLATLLAAQDWAQAERCAHTLRGVTATLGMRAISEQAGHLENRLAHASANPQSSSLAVSALHSQLNELTPTLDALVGALRATLGEALDGALSGALDNAPESERAGELAQAAPAVQATRHARLTLAHLIALAREGDASVIEAMDNHAATLAPHWPQAVAQAQAQLQAFDFERAADVLQTALDAA